MLTKRLLEIAKLVPKKNNVIDIGCDHALLDIYLTLYNDNNCIASDISEKVIENAKNNIIKYNLQDKIQTIVSNGIENIKVKKNSIIIISGMGTHTILDIVTKINKKHIYKIIIQSNNNLFELRKGMNQLGYIIEKEKIVLDRKKYYTIIVFKNGNEKHKYSELKYGKNIVFDSDYKKYVDFLIKKNNDIISRLNNKYILKKIMLKMENYKIKKHI